MVIRKCVDKYKGIFKDRSLEEYQRRVAYETEWDALEKEDAAEEVEHKLNSANERVKRVIALVHDNPFKPK